MLKLRVFKTEDMARVLQLANTYAAKCQKMSFHALIWRFLSKQKKIINEKSLLLEDGLHEAKSGLQQDCPNI